jgi:diguanylate cyclase (GGDEF)-like protein
VRLKDARQERRFILEHLPLQRRATLAAALVVVVASAAQLIYRAWLARSAFPAGDALTLLAAVLVGLVLVALLRKDRRPRFVHATLLVCIPAMSAMVSVLLVTGVPVQAQGALWMVGGVIAVYFSARLDLTATVAAGLTFSAITIPTWLASGMADSNLDKAFTVIAIALAHVFGYVEVRQNARERRVVFAQRAQFEALSIIDPLTGLVNRRLFDADLLRWWETWQQTMAPLSLLMIDIDHFKRINDTFGHPTGDRDLQRVADLIRHALLARQGHSVARYGGEEFACLLPGYGVSEAAVVAERIVMLVRGAKIKAPAGDQWAVGTGTLTVSVGVAAATFAMRGPQDLTTAADEQLYLAKSSGRDQARTAWPPRPSTVELRATDAGADRRKHQRRTSDLS